MGGTLVWSDAYPDPDRFDGVADELRERYSVLSRYRDAAALLEDERGDAIDRVEPAPATVDDLRDCCSDRRLRRLLGSPPELSGARAELRAEALAVGGTLAATDAALEGSRAVHLGGGFHHAHRGGSSARAHFNDVVAAVEHARRREGVERIAVVDLDVHHHDGTRAVYRIDGDVSLCSVHGWNPFPGTGWLHETGRGHAAGNHLNVPLPAGTDGRTYLAVLDRVLPPWVDRADPDFVCYVAGGDVHARDPTGNLELSVDEIYERDRVVVDCVGDRPLAVVLGGGYGPAAATVHANTAAAVLECDPIRTAASAAATGDRAASDPDETGSARATALRWLSSLVAYYGRHHPGTI